MCIVIQKVLYFINKIQFIRNFIFIIMCGYYKDFH